MIQEIKMPSAGQTTDEAMIASINVKVGDTVSRGDVLLEAETDKAVLPVESFANGEVLAILVEEGDTVDAGTILMAIGNHGEVYAPGTEAPAAAVPVAAKAVGTQIKMPSAGQTTDEAMIASVNVKVGDMVSRGDVLLEAETDKAVLPVESFAAGMVFDVLVEEGDEVTAGDVLVVIGKPEEKDLYVRGAAEEAEPAAEPVEEAAPVVVEAAPAAEKTGWPAMPNAKLLAKEKGIDLSQIVPSNGVFIKRQDVLAYQPAETAPFTAAEDAQYEVYPMSRMRQVIAKRMVQSVTEIPAFQATISVNMENAMALRCVYKDKKDVKLSYNDILAKAVAVAARKYPLINTRYEEGEVRVYKHTNIGLAVGLDGALVVPVVKNIDQKGLEEIAVGYKAQITKAREGALTPADMGCGSITISNLGMYDIDQFIAIVNPPESGILAVGSIKVEPDWNGKEFVPVHKMNITGSFDHRIIDGAYGAQFLQEVKLLVENPTLMLG